MTQRCSSDGGYGDCTRLGHSLVVTTDIVRKNVRGAVTGQATAAFDSKLGFMSLAFPFLLRLLFLPFLLALLSTGRVGVVEQFDDVANAHR